MNASLHASSLATTFANNENKHFNNISLTNTSNSRQWIDIVYPPILVLFGTMFNILIIMVMFTKHFRRQATSVYMISGAVNDALGLVVSMTTHWLYVTFDDVYVQERVPGICKFLDFYGWGNCDYGILITTAMTIDRALAITFPLRKHSARRSVRTAKIVSVILALIVTAKEFHFMFGSQMVDQTRKERLCDVVPTSATYAYFWKNVWPWLHFAFLATCFVTIIASNCVLLFFVWKSSRSGPSQSSILRKTKTNGKGSPVKEDKQWMTITPMLIGESLCLLMFTFPFTVQLFVSGYDSDFYSTLNRRLLFSVTFYMLYTNKCITFIVYIATGSRFRLALFDVFLVCTQGRQALRKRRFKDNYGKTLLIAKSISESNKDTNTTSQGRENMAYAKSENKTKTIWTTLGSNKVYTRYDRDTTEWPLDKNSSITESNKSYDDNKNDFEAQNTISIFKLGLETNYSKCIDEHKIQPIVEDNLNLEAYCTHL